MVEMNKVRDGHRPHPSSSLPSITSVLERVPLEWPSVQYMPTTTLEHDLMEITRPLLSSAPPPPPPSYGRGVQQRDRNGRFMSGFSDDVVCLLERTDATTHTVPNVPQKCSGACSDIDMTYDKDGYGLDHFDDPLRQGVQFTQPDEVRTYRQWVPLQQADVRSTTFPPSRADPWVTVYGNLPRVTHLPASGHYGTENTVADPMDCDYGEKIQKLSIPNLLNAIPEDARNDLGDRVVDEEPSPEDIGLLDTIRVATGSSPSPTDAFASAAGVPDHAPIKAPRKEVVESSSAPLSPPLLTAAEVASFAAAYQQATAAATSRLRSSGQTDGEDLSLTTAIDATEDFFESHIVAANDHQAMRRSSAVQPNHNDGDHQPSGIALSAAYLDAFTHLAQELPLETKVCVIGLCSTFKSKRRALRYLKLLGSAAMTPTLVAAKEFISLYLCDDHRTERGHVESSTKKRRCPPGSGRRSSRKKAKVASDNCNHVKKDSNAGAVEQDDNGDDDDNGSCPAHSTAANRQDTLTSVIPSVATVRYAFPALDLWFWAQFADEAGLTVERAAARPSFAQLALDGEMHGLAQSAWVQRCQGYYIRMRQRYGAATWKKEVSGFLRWLQGSGVTELWNSVGSDGVDLVDVHGEIVKRARPGEGYGRAEVERWLSGFREERERRGKKMGLGGLSQL